MMDRVLGTHLCKRQQARVLHDKKTAAATAAAAAAEQEALMSFELTMMPVEGVVFENTDEARCTLMTAFG